MELTNEDRKNLEDLETRTFALEFTRAEGEEESRTIDLSFASEEPVLRSFGWEILSHERQDIDLDFMESGRAPLLLNHNPEVQIGVIQSASLDATERKSRSVVRFGKGELASEIFADVNDKIRTNISVGYTVNNLEKQDEQRDGTDVYRANWTPMEISLVSIPLDSGIGVGRAEIKKPKIESKKMENTTTEIVSEPARKDEIDFKKEVDDILAQRAKDNKEMQALGYRHNLRDFTDECIAKNMSLYEFRAKMLDKIETKPLESIEDPVDIQPKEQKRYSFLKALNAASRGDWSGAGFESEMSQEMAHKVGKQPQGFYVPDYAWRSDLYQRELTVGTVGTGGYFAPSQQLGSEWIGALRAKMVLADLGMRTMSGLTTKVQIPKIAAASAGFVAESGDVSDNTHVTTQITMQARTLGARTTVSRLLLLESDPSIEQIVRDDLVSAIASKIQNVAFNGGGSNEPDGVLQQTGIGIINVGDNGGPPTWALISNLLREVEIDNAIVNEATLGWATNPKLKSKMSQVAKVGSSDSVMLLNEPWNALYGLPIRFSTDVPSNLTKGTSSGVCSALIVGDWSQVLMGSWGNSPDVLVDPYGNNDGGVKIIVFSEVDIAVRHAQSFAHTSDYTTT